MVQSGTKANMAFTRCSRTWRNAGLNMTGKIIFTGFRKDPLEILSTFDCFVMSSHLEGLCTSIMDAQVLGVPVAATDTGGIPDLIDHEQTGLLAPPGQPERLAENIVRLLTDPTLSERCRTLAKKKAIGYDYAFAHVARQSFQLKLHNPLFDDF